jgi:hypothetical protein
MAKEQQIEPPVIVEIAEQQPTLEPKIITVQGFEADENFKWQDVSPGVILVAHNPAWALLGNWQGDVTYTFKAFRPNAEGVLEDLGKSATDFAGVISLPRSLEYLSPTGYNQISFSPNSSIQVAFIGGFNAAQR